MGVFAGARRALEGQVALLGARAEVAVLRDEGSASQSEARIGAYAGLVASDVLPVPLRATLALDVLPAELGVAGDSTSGGRTPWWAVSLGLGVEFGGA